MFNVYLFIECLLLFDITTDRFLWGNLFLNVVSLYCCFNYSFILFLFVELCWENCLCTEQQFRYFPINLICCICISFCQYYPYTVWISIVDSWGKDNHFFPSLFFSDYGRLERYSLLKMDKKFSYISKTILSNWTIFGIFFLINVMIFLVHKDSPAFFSFDCSLH